MNTSLCFWQRQLCCCPQALRVVAVWLESSSDCPVGAFNCTGTALCVKLQPLNLTTTARLRKLDHHPAPPHRHKRLFSCLCNDKWSCSLTLKGYCARYLLARKVLCFSFVLLSARLFCSSPRAQTWKKALTTATLKTCSHSVEWTPSSTGITSLLKWESRHTSRNNVMTHKCFVNPVELAGHWVKHQR